MSFLLSDYHEEEEEKRDQLYQVQVRRRGLFGPIGKFKSAKQAFLKGKKAVEISAAASFKVEPLHGPEEDLTKTGWSVLPRKKFRPSKRQADIYVQRRRFRISTGGEKREITYKGIQAVRLKGRKKKKKGIFDMF